MHTATTVKVPQAQPRRLGHLAAIGQLGDNGQGVVAGRHVCLSHVLGQKETAKSQAICHAV